MATRNSSRHAQVPRKRVIVLLVMVIALMASLAIGSFTTKASKWSPELALDLQGGTQIILTPTTTDNSEITESDIKQAIEIIRQRVDASGVAEAEISSEGGKNIIVGLPGKPSEETLQLVRTSAVMRMRPVLQIMNINTSLTPAIVSAAEAQSSASESPSATATEGATDGATAPESPAASDTATTPSPDPSATYSPEELAEVAKKFADANADGTISEEPATAPTNASDTNWVTEKLLYDAYMLDCTKPDYSLQNADDPTKPMVSCDEYGQKYLLGPSEIEGTHLTQASSGWDQQNGRWIVQIQFDSEGGKKFAEVTQRLTTLTQPQNQFAVVLDGKIISAATANEVISGGSAQISGGGINQQTSVTLANQLSFGSLPLQFTVQSEEQISATLGSESLHAGLLAGAIGVILLVIYLLCVYQGLGVVAIASIAAATGISYLLVSLLSWTIGYRLSMAGVVGFIVSIGITADSFIVFFERIRDEIREGRSLASAVEHGWHRAKRTIYVADGCNLLCALVLYFLAVGSVRGFAFTLGLTTVLDLVVVIMFTYPIMAMLVRRKFFGEGHRFSGMSAEMLGQAPAYRGRGEFRPASERSVAVKVKAEEDAADEQSVNSASSPEAAVSAASAPSATSVPSAPSAPSVTSADEATGAEEAISAPSSSASLADDPELEGLSLAERKAVLRRRERGSDVSGAAQGGE